MELRITGTNSEITPTIQEYAERKINRLTRYFPNIMESTLEISEERTKSPQQHYLLRITAYANGATFHAEERGPDLFRAIDKVSTVMARQLKHYKGKMYDKRQRTSLNLSEAAAIEPDTEEAGPKLVKVKRFDIKPMTLEEAQGQMELLKHDFFLFYDVDTNDMKLLYRRKDGDYGLIEAGNKRNNARWLKD